MPEEIASVPQSQIAPGCTIPPMVSLPIDHSLPAIVQKLRERPSLVLVAPPGAGKTTRVPPAILRAGLLGREHPNLLLLQPRRVAARTVAARIAEENDWRLGEEVGYHVRFDRKIGNNTRLRVLTEGILTRQLLDDPILDGVGAVLLDEFHERSIHTDMAIALLREVQQTVRPDLILIVMSATLEAEPAGAFLGNCPIVRAEGRTFPVEVVYRPTTTQGMLSQNVADAVLEVMDNSDGDVLAFLPGAEEIRRAQRQLESAALRMNFVVLPLYGSLPAEEQNRALRQADRRKVILATNIAETSLTIDGVRTVVDGGFVRVASYDADRGLDRLDLQRISKASATQRAGRAGRTGPGKCVRLWTEKQQHDLEDFQLPEIRRVDLSATLLTLHAWGKPNGREFGWYETPAEAAMAAAERLLAMLGALSSETNGRITPLGQKLAAISAHPRLARLLLRAAEQGLAREGATLAAILAEKDFLQESRDGSGANFAGESDLILRMMLLEKADNSPTVQQVRRIRDELLRLRTPACAAIPDSADREEMLLRLALEAYPDRVCKRRAVDPSAGVMVGGSGVRLARESAVHQGEFFVAVDARHDQRSTTREALVRIASIVRPQWLEEIFPQSIRRESGAEFDSQRQRVIGFNRVWYLDLLLREDKDSPVEEQMAGEILGKELRRRAGELFTSDEKAKQVLLRVGLLRQHLPEHAWPEFGAKMLGELLAQRCAGKRSVAEVLAEPLEQVLLGALIYPLDRILQQQAPEMIEVPSGSQIALQYSENQPPVLAVRLQELFGWTATPTVAGGRKVRSAASSGAELSPGADYRRSAKLLGDDVFSGAKGSSSAVSKTFLAGESADGQCRSQRTKKRLAH